MMQRSGYMHGALFLAAATVATLFAETAGATATSGVDRYPEYDLRNYCHMRSVHNGERRHDCEDREYAVAILLRRQWPDLIRSDPTLTTGCAAMIENFEEHPSYVTLLQCLTRVRDVAD